jgi:hypothetical protein
MKPPKSAGLARESLSRALGTPHVAEHLRLQTVRRLGIAAARAGHNKVELLDIDPELVRDHASSFVLGLAGIAPASTRAFPSISRGRPATSSSQNLGPPIV